MFLKKETEKGLATWFALISSWQPSWTTDKRCRSQCCFYCFSLKTIPPPAWGVPATGGNPDRARAAGDSGPPTEPPKPTFNYRATGGSGSHTVRQSQCSTTGPLGAAVLTQADRTNVQLQGRWGQRFSYGADRANVQLQGFRTGRLCFSRALSEHTALFSALP